MCLCEWVCAFPISFDHFCYRDIMREDSEKFLHFSVDHLFTKRSSQ